jgi:ketosteroid isomerase-like protein
MAKTSFAGIALALLAAGPAAAQDMVAAVVQRHQDAFAKKDVAALLADYGDDAVVVFPNSVPIGKAKIGAMFAGYFSSSPASTNFDVKIDRVEGDVGFTKWIANPGTPKAVEGSDVFVVRGGKIRFQATYNVHPVAQAATAAAK